MKIFKLSLLVIAGALSQSTIYAMEEEGGELQKMQNENERLGTALAQANKDIEGLKKALKTYEGTITRLQNDLNGHNEDHKIGLAFEKCVKSPWAYYAAVAATSCAMNALLPGTGLALNLMGTSVPALAGPFINGYISSQKTNNESMLRVGKGVAFLCDATTGAFGMRTLGNITNFSWIQKIPVVKNVGPSINWFNKKTVGVLKYGGSAVEPAATFLGDNIGMFQKAAISVAALSFVKPYINAIFA